MTKFGEQRSFAFSGIKKLFRLPITEGNSFMYVNVGDNSIVKAQDMKLIHSWTITHPSSFTSPVVYNPTDELLYCILDNQTLIKWSPNNDSLTKTPKIKFQESVFAVFIIPEEKPIILFNSCHIMQICDSTSDSEKLELTAWNPKEKMIWADAIYSNDVLQIFCLGSRKKTNKFKLHCFKINKDNTISSAFEQDIFHSDFVLKSWCINKFDSTFFSLWSDGVVLKHETFTSANSELLSVSNSKKSHFFSMHSIDESHVCIAKAESNKKDCQIELWDFKFSICKIKKTVQSLAPINHIQLAFVDSSIMLLLNEDLFSLPLHLEKATIASVLGVCAPNPPEIFEFSWNNQGQVQSYEETESMEVDDENIDENVDENISLKTIVEKLSKEGSNCFKYIPDMKLVSLLRLALRCINTVSEKESSAKNAHIVLNEVFSSSFSDVSMMNLLKNLNCEETLAILQILLSLLKNLEVGTNAVDSKPSDFQVLSWICLLVQSHMETLLLSKDEKIILLLKELNKCLIEKMEEYEDFEKIRNYLLLSKDSFPKDNTIRKYTIENLE